MNEAEKERLIKKDIASIENRVRHAFNQGYEMGVKESSSEKPNKWIGVEVLDKIRDEIHATAEMHEDGDYYLRDEWIDEIIDKYKAESEAEE